MNIKTVGEIIAAQRKRGPYQFSLKAMLVAVGVLGIALAGVMPTWNQRAMVRAVRAAGGKVEYERRADEGQGPLSLVLPRDFLYQVEAVDLQHVAEVDGLLSRIASFSRLHSLVLSGTNVSEKGLATVANLRHLKRLYLARTAITDEDLASLSKLTELELIVLDGTKVSDDGLAHLTDLPRLEQVFLRDTTVTDDGLASLAELKRLRRVSLSNTRVTDAGMALLTTPEDLEFVVLDGTRVTDVGLLQLAECDKLHRLSVDGTAVTRSGIRQFQNARPNCEVAYEPNLPAPGRIMPRGSQNGGHARTGDDELQGLAP